MREGDWWWCTFRPWHDRDNEDFLEDELSQFHEIATFWADGGDLIVYHGDESGPIGESRAALFDDGCG